MDAVLEAADPAVPALPPAAETFSAPGVPPPPARAPTEYHRLPVGLKATILSRLCDHLLDCLTIRAEVDRREAAGEWVAGKGGAGGAFPIMTEEERRAAEEKVGPGQGRAGGPSPGPRLLIGGPGGIACTAVSSALVPLLPPAMLAARSAGCCKVSLLPATAALISSSSCLVKGFDSHHAARNVTLSTWTAPRPPPPTTLHPTHPPPPPAGRQAGAERRQRRCVRAVRRGRHAALLRRLPRRLPCALRGRELPRRRRHLVVLPRVPRGRAG